MNQMSRSKTRSNFVMLSWSTQTFDIAHDPQHRVCIWTQAATWGLLVFVLSSSYIMWMWHPEHAAEEWGRHSEQNNKIIAAWFLFVKGQMKSYAFTYCSSRNVSELSYHTTAVGSAEYFISGGLENMELRTSVRKYSSKDRIKNSAHRLPFNWCTKLWRSFWSRSCACCVTPSNKLPLTYMDKQSNQIRL